MLCMYSEDFLKTTEPNNVSALDRETGDDGNPGKYQSTAILFSTVQSK